MEIRRFFVERSDIASDKITLGGDEFLHMTKVLRYKVGYKAIVCANDGIERLCTIEKIERDFAILNIDEERVQDKKNCRVTLFAGLLKNNKLDFAIQKAVELGVDEVYPFVSQNSAETKFSCDRANKIALESAKQCGSAYLTKVGELTTLNEILDNLHGFDKVLFAYEDERKNRIKDSAIGAKNIALIVGPEGGFTPEETAYALQKGAQIVTLGKRILRAETASIIACTLLLDCLGELDYE